MILNGGAAFLVQWLLLVELEKGVERGEEETRKETEGHGRHGLIGFHSVILFSLLQRLRKTNAYKGAVLPLGIWIGDEKGYITYVICFPM